MAFQPTTLDYTVSPHTGYTRDTWLEAAKYLLTGIFQHISDGDAPVVMPRRETKITYPHLNASKEAKEAEEKAEMFEGLTRSFFIAAPFMKNRPTERVCGYLLQEYYKRQILRSCTKTDPIYVGNYEDLQEMTGHENPTRAFQQTVETCALVIGLQISKAQIWDTYTPAEKDCIAGFLSSFGHANTVPQNWRLFNMLDMAFLHQEGYPIDAEIMADHGQAILNYYVGDGWYRDGHSFDYYSCWAFQVYAPLWNQWYGEKEMPGLAAAFAANSNKLMETYSDFFDRDGFTNMWGRSNIYRNASTSAFDGNLMLKESTIDPGLARRISSGSLKQFLEREDFLDQGIPTLGFYGQFSPLVQGYSCAESPFWLGKAFLCLDFPENHPFWQAKENNGSWDKLKPGEVKETCLNGPALCFTNHQANGETILRTGKVLKHQHDISGMWNYAKLCYNTKYPWEATPMEEATLATQETEEVESQQYVLLDGISGQVKRGNALFWTGQKDGVLYRRQFFGYNLEQEAHWILGMNLADFPVQNGIFRVDRHRLFQRPVTLTLGAYGFPDNGTTIAYLIEGNAKAIVLKGADGTGKEKQLAMTIYDGWEELSYRKSQGTNPESVHSIVVYAKASFSKQYGGGEPYVMISQVLTKESQEDFTQEELFPLEQVLYADEGKVGSYGPVTLVWKNGTKQEIDFSGIEGALQL